MILGFNTGKLNNLSVIEKINLFKEIGCNAIEFSVINFNDFDLIKKDIAKINPNDFSYRSLHGALKIGEEKIMYRDDQFSRDILKKTQWLCEALKIELVVMHPDRVEDWSVFKNYNIPIAVENMDRNKTMGKTVGDLKNIFSNLGVPMVLDVNHCYTIDKTMGLTKEFSDAFAARIKEIHLSGFVNYHEMLAKTKQIEIIESIPNKNLPIIIESACITPDEFRREYEYVSNNLN